jgi:hypothetical protein
MTVVALATNIAFLPESSYDRSGSIVTVAAPSDDIFESKEMGESKDSAIVIVQPRLNTNNRLDMGDLQQPVFTKSNLRPWRTSTGSKRQGVITAIYRPAL